MNKPANLYESHLTLRESSLPPGGEWRSGQPGWSLIHINRGTGYWLESSSSTELEAGSVLLVAGDASGSVRASVLNGMSLHCFNVIPARLTGLITLGELESLKQAATRRELACRILPIGDPVRARMAELCARSNRDSLLVRLNLLQLVVEILDQELQPAPPSQETEPVDARERLRKFLAESPPDALLEIGLDELARMTHCTPRHLSRIFYELVGMSFRDKRAEIRLARASELLATSQTKVVEVALDSGYKSLSFFNLMFTRRYGISPGRWRQKNGISLAGETRRNRRTRRLAS